MNLARDDDGLTGALARARETGVAVRLRGELPADGPLRALALCAIRECALNCSRHAGGTELCVRVANGSAIAITNNGAPPEGEIREGGGLSALRQRVESSGGTMKIISSPAFLLEIKLPRRETEA